MVDESTAIFKDKKDKKVASEQWFENIKNDNWTDDKELMDPGVYQYHQYKVCTMTGTFYTMTENDVPGLTIALTML